MAKGTMRKGNCLKIICFLALLLLSYGCSTVTTVEDATTTLGGSLEVQDGFYVLTLRGTPEAMGIQYGTLLKDQITEVIQGYVVNGIVPMLGLSWTEAVSLANTYENGLPEEFKTELQGIATGSGLSYEAILISQLTVDLAMGACSDFIVSGEATSDGSIIHCANLDWTDINNLLRDNLVIIYYEPSEGNKFVSLSIAGSAGVLAGMNENQLAMSITAIYAGSDLTGIPTMANIRRALQYCSNISSAETYLTEFNRTSGYTLSVSGGNPASMGVFEFAPSYYKKRTIGTQEVLVSTNHFISSEMQPHQTYDTAGSLSRYNRLAELISQNYGSITTDLAKTFMRDQSGGSSSNSINNSATVFSSIFLPQSLSFWIAKGPVSSAESYVNFTLE